MCQTLPFVAGRVDKVLLSAWLDPLPSPTKEYCRRHLVVDLWQPAYRCFTNPASAKSTRAWGAQRFWHAHRIQVEFQERFHVSPEKKGPIAVLGWANVSLEEADKVNIEQMALTSDQMLAIFGSLVFQGYRLSVTWDAFSNALQASLVCAQPEDGNYQYGLSARHPEIEVVLRTLLYKHQLTEDSGYRAFLSAPNRPSWS